MKSPTAASLKKVSPQNLARLGADHLAEILVEVAETRPELKRRLRMELAAEQGADHLTLELDKRLASLETSRSKVSWRKRPSFVADLEGLRALIAERLSALDPTAALTRLFVFMDAARRLGGRVRDKDGSLAAVFDHAAADIGRLLGAREDLRALDGLVEAIGRNPAAWANWLPAALADASPSLRGALLARLRARDETGPAWSSILRVSADAAGDVDAFLSTLTAHAARTPSVAAEAARRLLGAGRVAEAGRLLEGARQAGEPEFDWETAVIDYLEAAGQSEAAQAARWTSFERTLSVARARDHVRRLTGFDDVEAESRALHHAASFPDAGRALAFLMDWPALPAAAGLIEARADELRVHADQAELWAARLRARQPRAACRLLRAAAALAFKRREFATCERLTQEADTITVD